MSLAVAVAYHLQDALALDIVHLGEVTMPALDVTFRIA